MDPASHWEGIYGTRVEDEVSWFEADPATSFALVGRAIEAGARSVIDVGGGASRLVDRLLNEDLERIGVLDVSPSALATARRRLGPRAARVHWVVGDVTRLDDVGTFDVWHDRATFHFLTEATERDRYVGLMKRTVNTGGYVVIATFATDGPERCSGLNVRRYDTELLGAEVGSEFTLLDRVSRVHVTPRGVHQSFVYAMFQRQ
jgi:SAM-dependent methyltransferase